MMLVSLLAAVASCSSSATQAGDGGSSGAPACDSPSQTTIDPPVGATATRADVEQVLTRSCAVGGCHAGTPGAADLTFPLASSAWVANVVNRPALENPAMMLVAPGDLTKSWLVHKLTGDFCAFESTCDPQIGCGTRMPFGQALSVEDMTTVVVGVKSGAPD